MKFTPKACNTYEVEKIAKKSWKHYVESDFSVRNLFFQYSEINRNSIGIGLFAEFFAKLLLNIVIFRWLRSLWSEKNSLFSDN